MKRAKKISSRNYSVRLTTKDKILKQIIDIANAAVSFCSIEATLFHRPYIKDVIQLDTRASTLHSQGWSLTKTVHPLNPRSIRYSSPGTSSVPGSSSIYYTMCYTSKDRLLASISKLRLAPKYKPKKSLSKKIIYPGRKHQKGHIIKVGALLINIKKHNRSFQERILPPFDCEYVCSSIIKEQSGDKLKWGLSAVSGISNIFDNFKINHHIDDTIREICKTRVYTYLSYIVITYGIQTKVRLTIYTKDTDVIYASIDLKLDCKNEELTREIIESHYTFYIDLCNYLGSVGGLHENQKSAIEVINSSIYSKIAHS